MTDVEKKQLIMSYQEDFQRRTGEYLKVISCTKWEAAARIMEDADFWKMVKIIFDFTGWTRASTFNASRGARTGEKIFRRSLVYFLAVNNGCSYNSCARFTERDHTTVINSVSQFESKLETELHTRIYFYEVIRYIKENYHLYKDKNITDQDIT